jgi:hypothetical protein
MAAKINLISIASGQKPQDILNSGHARIQVYANARQPVLTETWILPLPKGFNENYENNWKAVELTPIEAGIRNARAGSIVRGVLGAAKEEAAKAFHKRTGMGEQLSGSIDKVGSLVTGLSGNPYTELMYKSPQLRQFQYSWTIVPVSAQEAEVVKNFVKSMRTYVYPKLAPGGFFVYPGVFKIQLVGGSGNVLSNTNDSACVSFQVNFDTEGSPYIHPDGNPVSTTITMVTQETALLDRGEIGVLYDGDSSSANWVYKRLT